MILGSVIQCPDLNWTHVPTPVFKCVRFDCVEAYGRGEGVPLDRPHHAACADRVCFPHPQGHSVQWEPDCYWDFQAMQEAIDLQGECILQDFTDLLYSLDCYLNDGTPLLGHEDVLRTRCNHFDYNMHYSDFNDDDMISGSGWEVPGDESGIIPDNPTTPLHLRPEWIQTLSTNWDSWRQTLDFEGPPQLQLRSWFLQPNRFQKWASPRLITMASNTDYWEADIRTVWHDVLEHHLPVEIHLVEPPSPRAIGETFFADVILAQDLGQWCTTLISARFWGGVGQSRLITEAHLVPWSMTKWQIIFHAELDRFCNGPAWPVDFWRLCQLFHYGRLVRGPPEELHYGDCVEIEIHPPEYIEPQGVANNVDSDESDEAHFMGRNPILVRPMPDDPQANDYDDDLPSQDDVQSDHSGHSQWASTIIFTLNREGIVGRIRDGSTDYIYNQAADMLEISELSLLRLHDVRHRPHDLGSVFDHIWIAHRLHDLPQGSHLALILLDIDFCESLPKLDTETIRQAKAIVSTLTKSTLLRLTGLEPYCSRWPCLVKINGDFAPDHAPFEVQHGDHLHIIVAPPSPCHSSSTRIAALAFHHGLDEGAIPHLERQMPDGIDLEQMPNPDPFLNVLEFDDPGHFELLQRSLSVTEASVPQSTPKACRLDEQDEIRQRVQQIVDLNEANPIARTDQRLLEILANERAIIRDLHGLWLRTATTWFNDRAWAKVAVWYVSHIHQRICPAFRELWLDDQVQHWYDAITTLWADRIDHSDVIEIAIATPQPLLLEEGICAHLIIYQHHESQEEAVALVSLTDSTRRNGSPDRNALVLPIRITHELLLTIASRLQICFSRPDIAICTTWFGDFELTYEGMIGRPGLAYHVDFRSTQLFGIPQPPLQQLFPTHIDPRAPRIIQHLHAAIVETRARNPAEVINLRITTWMLNHHTHPSCLYGREVDLPPNPSVWLLLMLNQWPDVFQPREPYEAFLVSPKPQNSMWAYGDAFHVIIHQQPRPTHASVLITTFDRTRHDPDPPGFHRAIAVPRSFRQSDILHEIELLEWCRDTTYRKRCDVFFGALAINTEDYFTCSHGFSLKVVLDIPSRPTWINDDEEDMINLLQLHQQPQAIRLEDHLPPLDAVGTHSIDMAPAIAAFHEIDNHFFTPTFNLEALPMNHPARPWVQHWWTMQEPFSEVAVYFDGSFQHNKADDAGSAGIGVAAFVLIGRSWLFAGALGYRSNTALDSYQAEQEAGATAMKFAYDLIKVSLALGGPQPRCTVRFDSLTVGHQAEGRWACHRHPQLGSFLRSITCLCRSCFGCDLEFSHIRGHSGEPGNELVDWIADLAADATTPFHADFEDWTRLTQNADLRSALEWCWILFEENFQPLLQNDRLCLPLKPTWEEAPLNVLPLNTEVGPQDSLQPCHCFLRLATWNVQSVLSQNSEVRESPQLGPSRLECILKQMQEERITIFALQESRLRTSSLPELNDFFLFYSEADAKGRYGIIVGFSSTSTRLSIGATPKKLHPSQISYVHQDPRRLLLKVDFLPLKFLVVALHAPHSGYDLSDIQTWWQDTWELIPTSLRSWPVILLTDANATTGAFPSQHIGAFDAAPFEAKSQPFQDFVVDSDVFLPATFEELHSGDSFTWTHARGTTRRIDYIGLPRSWYPSLTNCKSKVCYDADTGREHPDHQMVTATCELAFDAELPSTAKVTTTKMNVDIADWEMAHLLRGWQHPSWGLDVHQHVHEVQQQLRRDLQWYVDPHPPRKPFKSTLTEGTWMLVQEKRRCRKALHELQEIQDSSLLSLAFLSWKRSRHNESIDNLTSIDRLMASYDVSIARTLDRFRVLGRQVTAAIRNDDKHFYGSLLSEGAELLHPKDVKHFWGVVRRSLPKFKTRRKSLPPLRQEALASQWDPHFCQLEVGEIIDESTLVSQCQARQDSALTDANSISFQLQDIPSLSEFENSLRATQPNKATGFDELPSSLFHKFAPELARLFYPLLLKIFMWRTEPIQFKGGPLALLYKKGEKKCIENYRGILLLPTVAKRLHAILRQRVIQAIQPLRPAGQLGGFPGQHVQFGSHWARTISAVFAKKQLNHGILFVDLANAFHRLVRETITGVALQQDFNEVLARLNITAQDFLTADGKNGCINLLAQAGCSHSLLLLLRDIHADTWCTLANRILIRTRRGTRPGSPLADVVFHILMMEISNALTTHLNSLGTWSSIIQQLDIEPPLIIWADDLAIPFAADDCNALLQLLDDIMALVHQTFLQRGFDINYDLGKTNAVIAFHGPGASQARKEHLLIPSPARKIQIGDKNIRLPLVHAYKHLGTTFSSSLKFDVEVKTRIGTASTAFRQLSRPILCNKRLPTATRLRLFHALIGSKLFFGLGSWPTLHGQPFKSLQTAYIGMIRKILRLGLEGQHLTNAQVLAKANSPCLRTKQALDRLLYARKLFEIGPTPLHHLLHLEAQLDPDSWLHGVHADLQWVLQVLPNSVPHGPTMDFTDIIDFWQDPSCRWKPLLRRARNKHLLQESLMASAHMLHRKAFSILRQGEAVFDPDPQALSTQEPSFHCKCGRLFTTSQGLAAHRRLKHGDHAQEFGLVDGATCPVCLKFFWTTNRLALHLAYVPRGDGINHCFHTLKQSGYQVDRTNAVFPKEVQGMQRKEALPTYGPIDDFTPSWICDRAHWQAQVEAIRQELRDAITPPPNPELKKQHLDLEMSRCVFQWLRHFREAGSTTDGIEPLADRWLANISEWPPETHGWLEQAVLEWGERMLPDYIAEFEDGEAEYLADYAFADLVELFPRVHLQRKLRSFERKLDMQNPPTLLPHRPVRRGTANEQERRTQWQPVPSLFDAQTAWQSDISQVKWRDLPPDKGPPCLQLLWEPKASPVFLLVHLFSGRRRKGDLHWWLNEWATKHACRVTVLSLDTAVHYELGNLDVSGTTWSRLLELYESGRVAGTVTGTPCETFTEARFQEPPEDVKNWPRPLRSALRLFGLAGLSLRELRQLGYGTEFWLQGLLTLCCHLVYGGYYIAEHPAPPRDTTRPSTWTAPLTKLLRQHPEVNLHIYDQFRFGATAVKPTGLLTGHLPNFRKHMGAFADWECARPSEPAIGLDAAGNFRTSKHKEYPTKFSAALAGCLTKQLWTDFRNGNISKAQVTADEWKWVEHHAKPGQQILKLSHWLPDFQGQ